MEAGEGRAGRGVGGGEEYTLRSGGSDDDSPKLPRPMGELPSEPPGSIWPCTLRTAANIGAVPRKRKINIRKGRLYDLSTAT